MTAPQLWARVLPRARTVVGLAWISRPDWSSHSWPVLKYDMIVLCFFFSSLVSRWVAA